MITGAPVNIFDFIPASEHAAIQSGNSTYDCSPAIVAAIASFPDPNGTIYYSQAGTIYFPPGKYYCATTIQLERAVAFVGANAAMAGNAASASTLEFGLNQSGFVLQRFNTSVSGKGGDSTSFQNLTITQKSGSSVGDGIRARTRVVIKQCTFYYWGGNGILILATAGGGAFEGNANCFYVENCVSSFNVGNGFKADGGDANAGTIIGLDCSSNGGYGFWESSFLGNTYISCHTAFNVLGGYYLENNPNNRTVYISCYSEQGQPLTDIQSSQALIISGNMVGTGWAPTTTAKIFDETLLKINNAQLLRGVESSSSTWELRSAGTNPADYFSISCAVGDLGARTPGIAFADKFFSTQGGLVPPAVHSSRAGLDATLVGGSTSVFQGKTRFIVKGGSANGFEVDYSFNAGASYTNYLTLDSNGNFYSGFDNAKTLGSAAKRWSVVYAGTGAINTSDERVKQQRADGIDPAVLRAWGKVQYAQYKFTDATEKKADKARWHFGLIAQRVKEAFESEGLNAFDYGLLCYDSWDDEYATEIVEETIVDENGDEKVVGKIVTNDKLIRSAGDRYGIRYEEALALECAYLRSKLS
jgi:hypothetical protein